MSRSEISRRSSCRALAGIIMFHDPIRDNLTAAYSASNAASARDYLALALEDADRVKRRIEDAYLDAVRDAKTDEEAPAPRLRVVR
jgi:hypothetical protein